MLDKDVDLEAGVEEDPAVDQELCGRYRVGTLGLSLDAAAASNRALIDLTVAPWVEPFPSNLSASP